LESRPGERREWFSRVLGIDYLKEQSVAILKERIDRAEHTRDRLDGEVTTLTRLLEEEDPTRLELSRINLEKAISSHQKAIEALIITIGNGEKQLQAFQHERSRFMQIAERRDAADRELEGLRRRKTVLEEQLGSLEKMTAEYEQLQLEVEGYPQDRETYEQALKVKARFDRLAQERVFTGRRLADLERRTRHLQEKEREYSETLDQQNVLIAEIRTQSGCPLELENASLSRWIQEKEHELALQTGSLNEIVNACGRERVKILSDWENIRKAGQDGECPLCHQRLGEHYPQLEKEFEDRLRDLVSKAENACELLESHERERSRLAAFRPQLARIRTTGDLEKVRTSLVQDRQSLDQERVQMLEEREQVERQINDLDFDEAGFSILEQKIRTTESKYRRFQETGRMIAALPVLRLQREAILQEEGDKQNERNRILEELADSSYNPLTEEVLQDELQHLREERTQKEADLARDRERSAKILESLNHLQEVQRRILEVQQHQADLLEETRLLKLTRSTISDYVTYLMQVVRVQIEQTAGEILSVITGGRYEQVLLDTEFNLRVSDMDNDFPIERFSGGEQDDIAVALRIALSHYLAELHQIHDSTFLIFDEIFGSQDEERRGNLLRALRTQESRFPQIILISHIPEIQGEFASTLVVEMESDQTSVVREAS
ncbi:MAG: hypothetical protein LUO93_07920, partial [Methanomicrobiales archaeon]|nr:hypothetical protein [Methanomicrobiales archaeon]